MTRAFGSLLFALGLPLALAACQVPVPGGETSDGSGGNRTTSTGGSAGNNGGSGGTAGTGTGGASPASGGTGGNPSGGNPSGGNASGGNGAASGGGSGSPGSGGSAGESGGSGGNASTPDASPSGDGGGLPPGPSANRPVKPSAGCGKANPATGARMITTGGKMGRFVVNVPAGYDPNTPLPLGFAFHGHSLDQCSGGCSGFRDLKAVTVFPKSLAAGWEDNPNPLLPNLQFFEDMVALMKAEYCIDENRVFVAGVSSGGQFVEHLACKYGDWLWGVSPVAAYVDKGVDMACKGTPPQIIIHGVTDRAGNFGQSVAELYAKRNGCTTPPAALAMAKTEMMAAFQGRRAEVRCLDWSGCTANPVRFCIFSQITYNNLTHGWPRVGGMLIGEFLGGLK